MDAYIGTLIGGLIGFLSSLGVQIAMRFEYPATTSAIICIVHD